MPFASIGIKFSALYFMYRPSIGFITILRCFMSMKAYIGWNFYHTASLQAIGVAWRLYITPAGPLPWYFGYLTWQSTGWLRGEHYNTAWACLRLSSWRLCLLYYHRPTKIERVSLHDQIIDFGFVLTTCVMQHYLISCRFGHQATKSHHC